MSQHHPHRILVTGADGQLAQCIRLEAVHHPEHTFRFVTRADMPIGDPEKVRAVFLAWAPTVCINCAAYTAVDRAEVEETEALHVNAVAVGILAAACREQRVQLIHLSTDYVFSGNAQTPYREDDPTEPLGVYGASKRAGEVLAQQEAPESLVIRTSWVYSEVGKNFLLTMVRLMSERDSVGVVSDQWGCPTYARDLADALLRIIDGGRFTPGIYHYCNEGAITWYRFATAIRDLLGSACEVRSIPTHEYPTPVRRPAYSVLDTHRFRQTFGIMPPPWLVSLEVCLSRLRHAQG